MLDSVPETEAAAWLAAFAEALGRRDTAAVLALLAEDCYWRDFVAFTWNIKTLEGKPAIAAMLAARLEDTAPTAWHIGSVTTEGGRAEAWFTFRTKAGWGEGIFRLERGKCRTILTTLQGLDGHEEAVGRRRDTGVAHGARRNRETWAEKRAQEEAERAALLFGHRRRAGRHHARRPPEGVWRADPHRREERQGRGLVAQPLPHARPP
jgi:putative flavoprotein involved in K+ transport